jgi:predicted DNA-binding transcriptional regulator AlpA
VTAALLVDEKQAAAMLGGISTRSLRRLVSRGEAPAPIHLGRLARWRVADLEAWIAGLAAKNEEAAR